MEKLVERRESIVGTLMSLLAMGMVLMLLITLTGGIQSVISIPMILGML